MYEYLPRYPTRNRYLNTALHVGANMVQHGMRGKLVTPMPKQVSLPKKDMPPVKRKRPNEIIIYNRHKKARKLPPSNLKVIRPVRRGQTSKSAGFISSRRRISKRQKKLGFVQNRGLLETHETGIVVSGVTDNAYLGHVTFVQDRLRYMLYRTLVKLLFGRMAIIIQNIGDTIEGNTGDVITLYYKSSVEDATAESTVVFTIGTHGTTYESIAVRFETVIADNTTPDLVLTSMKYQCNGGNPIKAVLNLVYGTVYLDIKSSIKIQNTTAPPTGIDEDQVDNIPLYGRSYFGNGTGTISNRTHSTETTFFANDGNGIIYKTGTIASGTAECPPASYFTACKGTGKVRIEPGHIKTNVLTHKQSYSIDKLTKFLYTGTNTTKDKIHTGKFAFFGLEHMIKATNTDANISLKAEVNWRGAMYITPKFKNVTDEKITQSYVTFP